MWHPNRVATFMHLVRYIWSHKLKSLQVRGLLPTGIQQYLFNCRLENDSCWMILNFDRIFACFLSGWLTSSRQCYGQSFCNACKRHLACCFSTSTAVSHFSSSTDFGLTCSLSCINWKMIVNTIINGESHWFSLDVFRQYHPDCFV